jgi:hypothetical protein
MTEHINDPCKEEEIGEVASPEGPSIPPVQPQQIQPPAAAFPVQESAELIPRSAIRESAMIETYSLNQHFVKGRIRLPEEAYRIPEWAESRMMVDTFRFVAAKNYQFKQSDLTFLYKGLKQSESVGVPFEIKINSSMLGSKEKNEISLVFDKPMFENLLSKIGISTSLDKFILGYVTGDPELATSNIPLIANTNSYFEELSFIAPAAFYKAETEQSSVPRVEVASFIPVVGNLALVETDISEIKKPSLYRLYTSTMNEQFPQRVAEDKIQKFDADAVLQIAEITDKATNEVLRSQFYNIAEQTLNNHIKIELNTNQESQICSIMKQAGLDSVFMDFLANGNAEVDEEFVQILDQSSFGGVGNNRLVEDYEPRAYNIQEFFERIYQNTNTTISFMSSVEEQHPIPYYEEDVSEARRSLEQAFFSGMPERMVNQLISEKRRSFKDIMQGRSCYSEVVAYRIEKSSMSTGEVLQEFYFFNDQETTLINFLDSQVAYNRGYNYRVYTINAVIGNKFAYSTQNEKYSIDSFAEFKPTYDFSVDNEVVFRLVESPYFEQQVVMIDKPPIFPEAEVIPFFQDDRKVGIRLTPTYGTIVEKPIEILLEDKEKINNMLMASGPNAEMVEYSSDSQPTGYEILILENPPNTYADFSQAQRVTTEATYNSGYIELSLEPNKRYYMLYRASDLSGISNPSLVYTLVLNSHADGIFVEYDEFDLIAAQLDEPLSFERVLRIDPAPEQTAIDFTQMSSMEGFYLSAPDVKGLSLGLEQEKVWSRDYKFRLISKTTGKAIDINVNYGLKVIEPPREIPILEQASPDVALSQVIREDQLSPGTTAAESINIFSQQRTLPGVETRYDEQGRPVESRVQQNPYPTRFPGN